MSDLKQYDIVIIGSGPGGMSAAGRAQELKLNYILLEATSHLSYTIHLYQKGKHVMDEPGILPLRSSFEFSADSRESILSNWQNKMDELNVNIQYDSYVESISGEKDNFTVSIKGKDAIKANKIVLGIGLQGNIRKMGVEGEDLPFVQYQLDDPEAYEDENIVVIGAGDAAIENAIALAQQNNVTIINRKNEFARAKQGNLNGITRAIETGTLDCYYNSTSRHVKALDSKGENGEVGILSLDTEEGITDIPIHRIIARLGAIPPRRFVESCGIVFPSKDPAAVPAISEKYESNVPGLYIVGALGGNPLIKAAMNQGYEVIEHILGNPIEPADEPLLKEKFSNLDATMSVSQLLAQIFNALPYLKSLTKLQFREFMLDSEIRLPQPGEVIYEINDFSNSFYSIVTGQVELISTAGQSNMKSTLQNGDFFGEWSLISGRRRSDTAIAGANCILIESGRRLMKKQISSDPAIENSINKVFILRAVQTHLAPGVPQPILQKYIDKAEISSFKPGEHLQKEGEVCNTFHLIRSGSVTVSRKVSGQDVLISYMPVGEFLGEMSILSGNPCMTSATATVYTETISLDAGIFTEMMNDIPQVSQLIESTLQSRLRDYVQLQNHPDRGAAISFMMQQGLGEATDVLVIDESLCVHCDNCEKACAETHNGTSRLDREAGPTYAKLHIPTSCRHCEQPHCMKDCPPDAIHRANNGEVYIDQSCIGCGNCQQNCPYGVIQMAKQGTKKTNLFQWLVLGKGSAPGEKPDIIGENVQKKAVKCDMCKDLEGGQACVRACPTGAAIRINPEQLVELTK